MDKYDICVVGGAGHAGLPLSIAFADRGQKVIISDKNKDVLQTIGNGRMPFSEVGAEVVLKRVIHKNLFLSQELSVAKDAKYVIVVIGTPIDEHLNPTYSEVIRFFERLKPFLRKDQVVILRSTVFPGVTEKIRQLLKGVTVCFCPERIAEGRAMEELFSLPQIVSGFDAAAIRKTGKLFHLLSRDIIYLEPLEAELAKLFTNSWRYVQFAVANQFYMIAEEYNADFYNIYKAMTYNYPRTRHFPKPGFTAGPCLFKDTMQIAAFTNHKFFLGHSAMLINEGLPEFLIGQLKKKYDLSRMTVGILGMAFKAESDDKRESLSYKLRELTYLEAKKVLCSDPYIKDESFIDQEILIKKSDIIIIGTPHQRYSLLNFKGKILVDVWGHARKGEETPAMKVLVTGAKGFIAGYLIEELLHHGWEVTGLDNLSKYGEVTKSYDEHPRYKFVKGDAKDTSLLKKLMADCDHFVAGAAMIGGIAYFHQLAYDLLAENERICASSFDAAIWAYQKARLKKFTVISSSMVFENAVIYPTPEGHQTQCPPPSSTYGFQKLATEYFAKGAYEQYQLPYTIVRPFNCIGIGEKRATSDKDIRSGTIKLALSHVVPDLAQKALKGQIPLHILGKGNQIRHYTYGGDLAGGIRLAIEKEGTIGEDFNLSTDAATTVLDLARLIWEKVNPGKVFEYVCDEPFEYDVQKRTPDTSKAKKILGFYATTSLEKALDEIIPWIRDQIKTGGI